MLKRPAQLIRKSAAAGLLALFCAACQPDAGTDSASSEPASLASFKTGDLESLDLDMDMQIPDVEFYNTNGEPTHFSDFAGKVVVMNIWATWCTPCMAEMPSLAALQREFSEEEVVVIPVASGMMLMGRAKDEEGKAAELEAAIVDHRDTLARLSEGVLPFYYDPGADVTFSAQTGAFPSTIIYDPEGNEVARLMRDADWSSDQARGLVQAVLDGAS